MRWREIPIVRVISPNKPKKGELLYSSQISNLNSTNEPLSVRRHLCFCGSKRR